MHTMYMYIHTNLISYMNIFESNSNFCPLRHRLDINCNGTRSKIHNAIEKSQGDSGSLSKEGYNL